MNGRLLIILFFILVCAPTNGSNAVLPSDTFVTGVITANSVCAGGSRPNFTHLENTPEIDMV